MSIRPTVLLRVYVRRDAVPVVCFLVAAAARASVACASGPGRDVRAVVVRERGV